MTFPAHRALRPRPLAGRALRLAARLTGRDVTWTRTGRPDRIQSAWAELVEHPALTWVPPLWRADDDSPAALVAARSHRVSALQRNLRVEVVPGHPRARVRLVTGPLTDRETPTGVDPLQPAALPFDLVAEGPTFEDAVVALRDEVRSRYPSRESSVGGR